MAGSLGTVRGQLALDVKQAIGAYAAVRMANLQTVTAMNRGGAVLRRAGVLMGGAGLVIAAGLGVAVKKAAEFEKQMDMFGAVSNATSAEMDKAREKALQLGKDTRYSAGEIADSFIELGKAGIKTNEIVDGIGEAVANLGAAADIPLVNASNIIVSAVQTFGLKASDATKVADKLAGAANASMVEVEDLGVSLKYAGGVAASLGVPFEDLNTAFALLGKYGIRGSTAGTSMRQMLIGLAGNSKKAEKEMKSLGIITEDGTNKFFTAAGKMRTLPEVMDTLNESMEGLTQEEKIKSLKTMFNVRSLPTVLNLMKEGSKGFDKMGASIEKTKAADVAAKRMDNLAGDVEILKGNIETFLIQAGTPFQEFLRKIVQGLTAVVQWFGELPAGVQQGILVFLAIAAAALIFMGAVSFIAGTVFTFIATMKDLWAALKLIKAALVAARASMLALNLAFLTNPVFLIIMAVIALIAIFVVLYKKNETFRNFINGIGAAIKTGFIAVVNWFKGLPAFFSNLWNSIKTTTSNVWNSIINFFTVTIPTFFQNAWNTITNGISSFISGVVNWFTSLPGRVMTFVRNLINGVVNWFSQLPARVGYFIGYMVGSVVRLWIGLNQKITSIVSKIVSSVISFFQKLPGRVTAFISNLYNSVTSWFTRTKDSVIRRAGELYNGVVNWIQKLPGRISSFFSALYNTAVNKVVQMKNLVVKRATELYLGVVNTIQQLPGRISAFFENMKNQAINKLTSMKDSAVNLANNLVNGFKNTIANLPNAASNAVNNAITAFKNMVSKAFNAAKDFAGGLWNGFKDGLGINSPSFIEKQMVQITGVVNDETRNLRGQVRTVQGLGNRLTKIPTMSASEPPPITSVARRMIDQLALETARNQEAVRQLQAMTTDTTAQSSRWTAQRMNTASQAMPAGASQPVRIAADQMDELGKRSVNVEMNNYNPVEEKSSQTAVREMSRLSQLEVI